MRVSVDVMRGRRVDISSGEGRIARGPVRMAVEELRVRDWWVRCVVRASWAVLSLDL